MTNMTIKCIVAAINSNGAPDLYFCKVSCTQEQYTAGDHYLTAKRSAEDEGYEPMLAFDENDPAGPGLCSLFVWDSINAIQLRLL